MLTGMIGAVFGDGVVTPVGPGMTPVKEGDLVAGRLIEF